MALLPEYLFSQNAYGSPMGGLLGNLPMWMTQPGASQGFPGMPTDMSAQSRAPAAPAQPGAFDRFLSGLSDNSDMLMGLGAGIMQGGLGRGLQMGAQFAQSANKRGLTDDIKEFEYAKTQGFKGTLADWMARKRAGAGEYGLQGIWGVGPDGKPALMQLGKSGEAVLSKLPEGFQPAKDPIRIDAGTHFVLLDPQTRQAITTVPKDLSGAERAKVEGKGVGEASVNLESIRSKMPGLELVVKKLDDLSNKATYTTTGQLIDFARREAGFDPRESAVARAEYISMVDNQILPLLRDTFGAQFTEREGQSLKATLGDPNKSPAEKQAVLKAFIEQKRRDVEALQTRVGQQPSAPAEAPAAPKMRRYNPETGKIE